MIDGLTIKVMIEKENLQGASLKIIECLEEHST